MKRKQILASGLLGCLILLAGILLTMLWFVKEQEAVSAALLEPVQLELCLLHAEGPGTKEQVTGLLPGESMVWKPAVILDGTSPEAWIRVRLEFGGVLDGSSEENEKEREERLLRIRELCAGIRFCDGWVEGADGYYYYKEEAAPGSIIQICEQVTIPESWDNEIAEKIFTIEVSGEAVRAEYTGPWPMETREN